MARKKDRMGQIRCLHCFTRFRPPPNAERATCPECGMEWRVSWTYPNVVRIRGPVWEKLKLKTEKPEPEN